MNACRGAGASSQWLGLEWCARTLTWAEHCSIINVPITWIWIKILKIKILKI